MYKNFILIQRLFCIGVIITMILLVFSCSESEEKYSSTTTDLNEEPIPDQNVNVSEVSNYGVYTMQSNNQVFTIENNGGIPLEINDVLITGTNSAEFVVNSTLPFTIEPYETRSINVECQPSGTGDKEINIMICSNDPVNEYYIFTIIRHL